MSVEDTEVIPPSSFEQVLAADRKVANSEEAEFDRLFKEEFGEDPSAEDPIVAQGYIPPKAVEAPSLLDDIGGFAKKIGRRVKAAKEVAQENPQQVKAGVGDMLSNVVNFGYETKKAFDSWMSGNGWTWADLAEGEGVDIGSMFAPAPRTDEERMARGVGKFIGEFSAHVGAAAVGGIGANALKLGAAGVATTGVASGGAASFLAFDPHETRLADMLQKDLGIRNFFIDGLANEEGDVAIDGRIKNAMESMLGDTLGLAAFGMMKMYRARRLAQKAAQAATGAVEEGVERAVVKRAAVSEVDGAVGTSSMDAMPKAHPVDAQSVVDDTLSKTQPIQPDIPNKVNPVVEGAPDPTLNNALDNTNTLAAGQTVESKVLNNEALEAAERTAGQSVGGAAPDVNLNPGTGRPINRIVEEAQSAVNVEEGVKQSLRYGVLPEEDYLRISEKINLGKYKDDIRASRIGEQLEEVIDGVKATSMTNQERLAKVAKRLEKDPSYATELLMRRANQSASPDDVAASILLADAHYQRAMELDELVGALTDPKQIEAVAEQIDQLFDVSVRYNAIAEGAASVGGQTTQMISAVGKESTSREAASFVRANADLFDPTSQVAKDATTFTYGDKAKKRMMIRQQLQLSRDMAKKRGGEVIPFGVNDPDIASLKKTSTWVDITNSYMVNNLLSGFETIFKTNPLSQIGQVFKQDWILRNMGKVAKKTGKKDIEITEDLLAEFWGIKKSKLASGEIVIPAEEIAAFRNFQNYRTVNPDIIDKIVADSRYGAFVEGISDMFRLKFLAKDGKFLPNTSAKIGGITRTMSGEQLEQLYSRRDLGAVMERVKLLGGIIFQADPKYKGALQQVMRVVNAPAQMMALGDAAMGTISARQAHHAMARKYAIANATSPLMEERLYREALDRPPAWMKKMVVDQMAENNSTTAITRENSPFLQPFHDALSHPALRFAFPFRTVSVNGAEQALESFPVLNKLSARTKANLQMGGHARDVALAKIDLGINIGMWTAGLAATGIITGNGPRDPVARQNFRNANPNWKPYSLHIPGTDKYVELRAFAEGPGRIMRFAADLVEIIPHLPEAKMKDAMDLLLAGTTYIVDQISPDFLVDETGRLAHWLASPNSPEGQKYFTKKIAALTLPASSFLRQARNSSVPLVSDPERRVTDPDRTDDWPDVLQSIVNEWKNQIPGLSSTLRPARNVWGDTVEYSIPGTGASNTSAIAYSRHSDMVVENEVVRLGMTSYLYEQDNPEGDKFLRVTMPRKTIRYEGADLQLNPEQYDDYIRLSAGDYMPLVKVNLLTEEEAKSLSKNNLRNRLKERIQDPSWKDLPDKYKRTEIATTIREMRALAKDYLVQLHPDLQMRFTLQMLDKQKASLPNGEEGRSQREEITQRQEEIRRSYRGPTL